MGITILDGAMGTALLARGVELPEGAWSGHAVLRHPDRVRAVHAEYAAAGADVHTAATFRTTRAGMGEGWADAARRAVGLAREACLAGQRVAGSIAPVEDCFRPDLSPPDAGRAHLALARVLVEAGCDVLLCETFPHTGEALAAAEAALVAVGERGEEVAEESRLNAERPKATGSTGEERRSDADRPKATGSGGEVWVSLTPGYRGDLLGRGEMAAAARHAAELGVSAVLVNCAPVGRVRDDVAAMLDATGGAVRIGAYANAGRPEEGLGWFGAGEAARAAREAGAARYAELARGWIEEGATIAGGCCGTDVEHVRALVWAVGGRDCPD